MKRTYSALLDTSAARPVTPLHEATIVSTPGAPKRMPVDLLDDHDLARFTRIRAMNFDSVNFKEEFAFGVPIPSQDFVSFVTSNEIPTDNHAAWALMEYVLSEFPTLAITLFQTVEPTDLSFRYTSEKIYRNLMDTLDTCPGLKEIYAFDNTISLSLVLELIAKNNSVVKLNLEDTLADGVAGEEIISAFSKNSTLEHLSLGPVAKLHADQLDCIVQVMAQHPTLTYFEFLLKKNFPENAMTDAVVQIIARNDCLKTLVIDTCCASDINIEKIAGAIKLNNTIQYLDCKIDFKNLSMKALKAIHDALLVNETITELPYDEYKTFDMLMKEEVDAEKKALFGSIATLLARNTRYSLPETIDFASGACAGFPTQTGLPPKLGFVLENFLTMKERVGLTGISKIVLGEALAYQKAGNEQRLADEDSTSSDAE